MNIIDYLETNFDTFDEREFGVLDSAVLSQLSMVELKQFLPVMDLDDPAATANDVPAVCLPDLLRVEYFADMFTGLVPDYIKTCLFTAASSPRFRTLSIERYAFCFNERTFTQFAAVSFVSPGRFRYVGFRGTDKSLTGWHEDFDMTWMCPVPAQRYAKRYVETLARSCDEPIIIGGHSKGANLAEYVALTVDPSVRDRISRVYVHDGPGFKEGMFTEDDYAPIETLIHKTTPQDSVIGMLLESGIEARPVASTEKGVNQHNLFTWQIDGTDFDYVDSLTDSALMFSSATKDWISHFTPLEAETLVDALFRVIEASGAGDAMELLSGGRRTLEFLSSAARSAQGNDRDVLMRATKLFAESFAGVIAKEGLSGLRG